MASTFAAAHMNGQMTRGMRGLWGLFLAGGHSAISSGITWPFGNRTSRDTVWELKMHKYHFQSIDINKIRGLFPRLNCDVKQFNIKDADLFCEKPKDLFLSFHN